MQRQDLRDFVRDDIAWERVVPILVVLAGGVGCMLALTWGQRLNEQAVEEFEAGAHEQAVTIIGYADHGDRARVRYSVLDRQHEAIVDPADIEQLSVGEEIDVLVDDDDPDVMAAPGSSPPRSEDHGPSILGVVSLVVVAVGGIAAEREHRRAAAACGANPYTWRRAPWWRERRETWG